MKETKGIENELKSLLNINTGNIGLSGGRQGPDDGSGTEVTHTGIPCQGHPRANDGIGTDIARSEALANDDRLLAINVIVGKTMRLLLKYPLS